MSEDFIALPVVVTDGVLTIPLISDLPDGQPAGSVLFVDENSSLYLFDGTSWSVIGGGGGGAVDSVNGLTGAVNLGLGDLDDVDLTTPPASGDVLTWDGSDWVAAVGGGGGGGSGSSEGDGAYFLTNVGSDLGGGRLEMIRGIPIGGGASVSPVVTNGDLILEFATVAGYPNATYLPSGSLNFDIQARQLSGTKITKLYVEFYYRTLLGSETLIATSPVSDALTSSSTLFSEQVVIPVIRGLGATDRLTIKVRAEVTGAGTDPNISVEYQGVTNSRCRFPFEVDRTSIGLGNVDNTSDADKPISDDTQDALDLKADIAGTANTFAAYDSSNELAPYTPLTINADNGIDLFQTVGPDAGSGVVKHNNLFMNVTPTADSEENWYQLWMQPNILPSAFETGNPVTGAGGLNGLGMAINIEGDFGSVRNFDFSIQTSGTLSGYIVSAMNQYINIQAGSTVEFVQGIPVNLTGAGEIENATVFNANFNLDDVTNGAIGLEVGGNITFTNPTGSFFHGVSINPVAIDDCEFATGLFINTNGFDATTQNLAINAIGNTYLDGDLQVTGAFSFTGNLSVGTVNSFSTTVVVNNGGNPTVANGFVSAQTASGTVANCDTIGVSTPSLMNLDATFVGTSGGFGIGLSSLALPNVVTMAAGCSLDNLTAAAFVNLFDAANTGGTISRVIGCRATNIPQGGTQTITRAYSFFADFFAGDVAVDSWGFYDNGAKYNWIANKLKIGGSDTTAHAFEVDGAVLLDGDLGFYGTTPIAQPASSGAATAGGTYTATEQTMLQEVYNAIRALGLMT